MLLVTGVARMVRFTALGVLSLLFGKRILKWAENPVLQGFLVVPAALGIERARDFDVVYLGYNGDGHFGRLNLTASLYYAIGRDRPGTVDGAPFRGGGHRAGGGSPFRGLRTLLPF